MGNSAVTLVVACVFSALALIVSPAHILTVFLASVIWYPSSYTVDTGSIHWTVRRIVIVVILLRVLLSGDFLRQFKLMRLDKLVVALFFCETLAGAVTGFTNAMGVVPFLQYQSGQMFDMMLPYFAARLILANKERYVSLLKGILVISFPFAILAFYQFSTGGNPFSFVRAYYPKERSIGFRAELTFAVSIMLGLYFVSFGAACAALLRFVSDHNKWICMVALVLMAVGTISSASSGPMLALIMAGAFLILYRWKHEWRLVLTLVVLMCGSIEIVSNRHFYDVLGGLTLTPETAWYRSRLIDVALWEGGMSDHWLVGFGPIDPGWGPQVDGRDHTDVVNHYILILINYGLIGLIPFLWMNVEAVKSLLWAGMHAAREADQWLAWTLGASLFGLAGAFFSVSLFEAPTSAYYMLIAVAAAMPGFILEGYPPHQRALVIARG
jgi:hypothetical protein